MQIRFTIQANQDIDSIFKYLSQNISNDFAQEVLDRIENMIDKLPVLPEMGRIGRILDTRELVIPDLPYVVAYRIINNEIQILAIMHQRRRWL